MLVYTFFFFFFNLLHYKVTPINTGNLVCSLRSSSIKGFLLFSSCSKHSRWIFTHCLQWCSNLTLPGILVIVVTMTGDHPWHFRMPKILQCLKQCPVQWGIFLSPIPIMLPSKNPGLESLSQRRWCRGMSETAESSLGWSQCRLPLGCVLTWRR